MIVTGVLGLYTGCFGVCFSGMAIIPSKPSETQLKLPGTLGLDANFESICTPGTTGVNDGAQVTGAQPTISAFCLVMENAEFREIYEELEALGIKILLKPGLERPTTRHGMGGFDYWESTLELPSAAFTPSREAPDSKLVETVVHEVKHAHQHKHLLVKSLERGGTKEARTEIMDAMMAKMGRDAFVKDFVADEMEAESFAIRLALKILREHHSGYRELRGVFNYKSPKEYYEGELEAFRDLNSERYEEQAKLLWQDHLDREAERTRKPSR